VVRRGRGFGQWNLVRGHRRGTVWRAQVRSATEDDRTALARGGLFDEDLFAHCEQGKMRAIVAVF